MAIHPRVVSHLAAHGISELFPVQSRALNHIRGGGDVVVRSSTGSGKTLAFGIPLAERLLESREAGRPVAYGKPIALVLAPTRELALQVHAEMGKVCGDGLRGVAIYGGASMRQQEVELRKRVDFVVATPGRLVDFLDRGVVGLEGVEMCVLDEADEMLNIGFEEELDRINAYMPPAEERQNVLCSATFNRRIMSVAKKFLDNHHVVDLVGSKHNRIPKTIDLSACLVLESEKTSVLAQLLKYHKLSAKIGENEENAEGEEDEEDVAKGPARFKSLVFVQEKSLTESLAASEEMRACGIKAIAIHGGMPQQSRENALKAFRNDAKEHPMDCLIATDVAARGLDIPDVDLVIHFDLPTSNEKFVHRTGRTGRMGKSGASVLMYTADQGPSMFKLERAVGLRIAKRPIPSSLHLESLEHDSVLSTLLNLDEQSVRRGSSLAEKIKQKAPIHSHADILAAALGLLTSKHTHVSYSVMSGLPNRETIAISNARGGDKLPFPAVGPGQPNLLVNELQGLLTDICGEKVDVKRIDVTKDKRKALVDVSPKMARTLLENESARAGAYGVEIAQITGEAPPVWRTVHSTDSQRFRHGKSEWKRQMKYGHKRRSRGDGKRSYGRGQGRFRGDDFRSSRNRQNSYGYRHGNRGQRQFTDGGSYTHRSRNDFSRGRYGVDSRFGSGRKGGRFQKPWAGSNETVSARSSGSQGSE